MNDFRYRINGCLKLVVAVGFGIWILTVIWPYTFAPVVHWLAGVMQWAFEQLDLLFF